MLQDIVVNLPEATGLRVLQISPTFERYDELMQRAVMLLLTSDDPELTVDGKTPLQLISEATSEGIRGLEDVGCHYESALRRMLNDEENIVDRVDIKFSGESGVMVKIDITKLDATDSSGEFTL